MPLTAADVDLRSLLRVKKRASQVCCTICKRKGAASRCGYQCCRDSYHLPCAEAAGLVEWHSYNSQGLRIVHCRPHRDPLCEIWWEGNESMPEAAWWPAACISGPNEGFITVIYTAEVCGDAHYNSRDGAGLLDR